MKSNQAYYRYKNAILDYVSQGRTEGKPPFLSVIGKVRTIIECNCISEVNLFARNV